VTQEQRPLFSQLIKKTTSGHLQLNSNLNNGIEKKEKKGVISFGLYITHTNREQYYA
jgi:hypothetical protein